MRVTLNREYEKAGVKITMLAFLIKAAVAALRRYRDFNASLDANGDTLVRKGYFNIGFAADTPNGLVVPVVKTCDGKGVCAIAREMGELSAKAREGKLSAADMQGGMLFDQLARRHRRHRLHADRQRAGSRDPRRFEERNEAGLGRQRFVPRLVLRLSLSYDHRVIDGAAAARFTTRLREVLSDIREMLL